MKAAAATVDKGKWTFEANHTVVASCAGGPTNNSETGTHIITASRSPSVVQSTEDMLHVAKTFLVNGEFAPESIARS